MIARSTPVLAQSGWVISGTMPRNLDEYPWKKFRYRVPPYMLTIWSRNDTAGFLLNMKNRSRAADSAIIGGKRRNT